MKKIETSTTFTTMHIAPTVAQAERKATAFSGMKLLDMACYALRHLDQTSARAKFRLAIVVNGNITDILEQERPFTQDSTPDVELAAYSMDMASDGYGYDNRAEFIEDTLIDEPDFDQSTLHDVEITLTLTIFPLAEKP